ncbi:type I phosphomannose isomerase catalytic subunit [Mycoplasma putrefaciens]|uniref:Mannose-6-phosphate isomerase n=1 Tax=Mycoplasma putrefaciens (strain ATCC 15718 / NCTC 10155 / C30 KS-1 / KS-1) TaxID=743965 RepID=A0A7U4E9L9_MYCPK|nr:type I phosphomannose isomerase catalytic subunit [Mycoplasma putrefaciens]AEM68640.1 mannose-6-phosphate isomerase [Mycoplasma putrefaciens KS1]
MQILKLKPYFSEKLWGGEKLKEFGFDLGQAQKIGEAWVVSAHKNGMSYVSEGEYKNLSLKELFENHKHLFNNYQGQYPLLAKIITAKQNLSVQVHPDDEYALKNHQQLGKPECWYVLDCDKDAEIIYGHHARSAQQLVEMINDQNWDQLLKKVKIKKGDFVYVPPGKVHAISANVVVYELQRSSDLTYRLYDYNRIDPKTSQTRRLDLDDAINCITVPDSQISIINQVNQELFSCKWFSIYLLDCSSTSVFQPTEKCDWLQLTVIKGQGTINGIDFKQGQSAITIKGVEPLKVKGKITIVICWIKNDE